MVFLSEKQDNQIEEREFSVLIDSTILRAAQQIYRAYYRVHPNSKKRATGVAINPDNYRGQVIFGKKPILLPGECFVPLNQLESETY